MITLAQILGGLFGLAVAYGMYRFVEAVDARKQEQDAARHAEELKLYKEQLKKSVK